MIDCEPVERIEYKDLVVLAEEVVFCHCIIGDGVLAFDALSRANRQRKK